VIFEEKVEMWVFEENVEIPKTSKNYDASNPGPRKLVKDEDGAVLHCILERWVGVQVDWQLDPREVLDILIFNLPHQFIIKTCEQLKGKILPYARGISCIKGGLACRLTGNWIPGRYLTFSWTLLITSVNFRGPGFEAISLSLRLANNSRARSSLTPVVSLASRVWMSTVQVKRYHGRKGGSCP
jgi:hypothetical protein